MDDRHLNLFYSYNRDTELIENNLTRALIVALRALSPTTRNSLLHKLLLSFLDYPTAGEGVANFGNAILALQDRIDPKVVKRGKDKWLVTLSSFPFSLPEEEPEDLGSGLGSIPDAWIVSPEGDYCFLVESKVGSYSVDISQLWAHGFGWLGITSWSRFKRAHIGITWDEVVEALAVWALGEEAATANDQERHILRELMGFLAFYGHRSLKGVRFGDLALPPANGLFPMDPREQDRVLLNLDGLPPIPDFRLAAGEGEPYA